MFDSMPKQTKSLGSESKSPDLSVEMVEKIFLALMLLFFFGAGATFLFLRARPHWYRLLKVRDRVLIAFVPVCVAAAIFVLMPQIKSGAYTFAAYAVQAWLLGAFIVWVTVGVWLRATQNRRITTQNLRGFEVDHERLSKLLPLPHETPIGVSMKSGEPVVIPVLQRCEHMIGAGATGQGKTTLMMTMLKHSFLHGHPVIIIDPKGDLKDVEHMRRLAVELGRDRAQFKLFSLSAPGVSVKYNPLASGTPEQKRAKLMDGLNLAHEYYGAVASQALGTILSVYDFLGIEPSLATIEKALVDRHYLGSLQADLSHREESEEVLQLIGKIDSLQRIDSKDLAGLVAQLQTFNSREFNGLLSPTQSTPSNDEIRLLDVLEKRQIAYFQMNVNGYGDIARRLGKLIVQDLKTTAGRLHAGQAAPDFEFAACFIDEFGSFATADFADFLKQVRSARIGVHLFCQGMADLRVVSPEFEAQILGNTATKIIFRTDVSTDVESWAGQAGTIDDFDQSYQVERTLLGTHRTGLGTQNPSKKMKIDFDVFKSLRPGQAVLIDKARGIQDLVAIWDARSQKSTSSVDQVAAPEVSHDEWFRLRDVVHGRETRGSRIAIYRSEQSRKRLEEDGFITRKKANTIPGPM